MNELLNKLSSYNLFNYLLPGVIFAVFAGEAVPTFLSHRDVVTAAFLCYFAGLVVSRFGSLVVEPLLRHLSFVKFADYKDFVEASERDGQLAVLSEANNTYRTLSSLLSLLLLLRMYMRLETKLPALKEWDATIVLVLLLAMFLFSYRKQTAYIAKRVSRLVSR